jgi:hypothetical protein
MLAATSSFSFGLHLGGAGLSSSFNPFSIISLSPVIILSRSSWLILSAQACSSPCRSYLLCRFYLVCPALSVRMHVSLGKNAPYTRQIERFGDIESLAGCTIDTHESRFRKRHRILSTETGTLIGGGWGASPPGSPLVGSPVTRIAEIDPPPA